MANTCNRIAIIGCGLAGAILANALCHYQHLDMHVYESKPEFSERGAAVGLSTNALLGLKQIVPTVKELLNKAGAVPVATRIALGSGQRAGTIIADLESSDPGVNVHRASLLRELLALLPTRCLHANKELIAISETVDSVKVTFRDGVVEYFDAVIGADGIHSSVRSYVLQDAADECAASPAGFWDCRVLVSYSEAKATLGAQYFQQDRQYGWIGDGGFIMHDPLDGGETIQCVISAVERVSPKDRTHPITRETLTESLQSWLDGPIANGAIKLILNNSNMQGYSQWEHKSTPTYANGRVCIIGDAAHATTPWQGAGVGQAIEDAVILGTLFGDINPPREIHAVFKAYDAVRRPRGQQVIDSSRGTGQIFCGQDINVGLDPDKLRGAMASRWAFIFSLDLDKYKEKALRTMREFQNGTVETASGE